MSAGHVPNANRAREHAEASRSANNHTKSMKLMKILHARNRCLFICGVCLLLCQALLAPRLAADLGITDPGAGIVQFNSGNTNTYGWVFTVGGADLHVNGLGIWDEGGDGLASAHPVAIWDSLGSEVANTTVEQGTAAPLVGEFRIEQLPSPVTLAAGQTYTIGALYQGDAIHDNYHSYLGGSPTYSPDIQNPEGRFDNTTPDLVMPQGSLFPGAAAYGGPNFSYVVPEPATWALFAAGATLLIGRKLAKRRAR